MKTLEELDRALEPIMQDLKNFAENLNLNLPDFQVEFTLGDDIDTLLMEVNATPGIYLFEIKNKDSQLFKVWFEGFEKKWEKTYNAPAINKSQVNVHKKANTADLWVPLYIGKAADISKRIKQHIEGASTTYSMRLRDRKHFNFDTFRISTINLSGIKNYEVIATVIESTLRDKINPIVGKQ